MSIDADQLQNLLLNIVDCSIADRRANYIKLGATYNEDTGLYSLNGIDDLTEEDMDLIYTSGLPTLSNFALSYFKGRTNFYCYSLVGYFSGYITAAFSNMSNAETINLQNYAKSSYTIDSNVHLGNNGFQRAFMSNPKLHSIYGVIELSNTTNQDASGAKSFENSPLLKRVRIKLKGGDLYFNTNPNIDLESFTYLVENSTTTNSTVYVHQDVYNKFNDQGNSEWYNLNELAKTKNITFSLVES